MIRYPYTIEMLYEDDSIRNPDGTYPEVASEWRIVGKCNARQNGQAQKIQGANGNSFMYSYEVIMPPNVDPIPIGTQVRIIDKNGVNIFDRRPDNDFNQENINNSTYQVQGFYKSGQQYEDTRLWL